MILFSKHFCRELRQPSVYIVNYGYVMELDKNLFDLVINEKLSLLNIVTVAFEFITSQKRTRLFLSRTTTRTIYSSASVVRPPIRQGGT